MRKDLVQRRLLLASFGALACTGLSGCMGILGSTGGSGHGARRADVPVRPLTFNPGAGLAAINRERARRGLPAFTADRRLQSAAQSHADHMGRTGNYGHEFGPGTQFPKRIAAVNFTGSAGENIGVGYGSIEDAIEGWLNSPKHRKILLKRRYDRAGIAYSFNRSGRNPRYTHYWVLIVGREGGGARMRAI